jgi:hypothetical protein
MHVAVLGRRADDGGGAGDAVDRSADDAGTRGVVRLQLTVWELLL